MAVVVPARDEEALIGACLASIERATTAVRRQRPRMPVVTIVVDDSSSDGTADIARRFSGVRVIQTPGGNVGRARSAGVDHALTVLGHAPAHVWIANTDADTVVPEQWLCGQLALAQRGADVVLGTVQPTREELSPQQIAAWLCENRPGAASGQVHGANLGLRGSLYEQVGRFAPLPEHEDVDLVERLRQAGAHIVSSGAVEVLTSGRLLGRTPGGFAGYLRTQLVPAERVVP